MQRQSKTTRARIAFRALALVLCIAVPAAYSEFGDDEVAAGCGECSYTLHWNPQADATFFELYLVDPLAEDGRRLAYKGPSTHVRVVVRDGEDTALLRSCNVGSCSGFLEIPLIPERNGEPRRGIRFTEPVHLIHELDDTVPAPRVGWPASGHRALSVDVSAAGQPPCAFISEEPRWIVGTRLLLRLSDDLDVVVVNRHIIEHPDGRWTWTGDIAGDQDGVVAFTSDACGEQLYASIDSDHGHFAVMPSTAGRHVGYRVEPGDSTPGCDVFAAVERTELFELTEKVPETGSGSVAAGDARRSRVFDIDFADFESRFRPLAFLVGEDRDHDIARFVPAAVYAELFSGEPLAFDLHRGSFSAAEGRGIEALQWRGCVAGDSSSVATIDVVWPNQIMVLTIRWGDRYVYMSQDQQGGYQVTEAVLTFGRTD